MKITDISHDKKSRYRLSENEKVVFLVENRSGEIVFELAGRGAEARIVAFYDGTGDDVFAPFIVQRHLAPDTISSVVAKARLDGASSLRFEGRIEIDRKAGNADAHQECRVLLLSEKARATAKPTLEIKNRDVKCSHAATISPVNPDHLFYAATRGLDADAAKIMLASGFFKDGRDTIDRYRERESTPRHRSGHDEHETTV